MTGPTVESLPVCDRHGGQWGDDPTCETCCDTDGNLRPFESPGDEEDAGLTFDAPPVGTPMPAAARGREFLAWYAGRLGDGEDTRSYATEMTLDVLAAVRDLADDDDTVDAPEDWIESVRFAYREEQHDLGVNPDYDAGDYTRYAGPLGPVSDGAIDRHKLDHGAGGTGLVLIRMYADRYDRGEQQLHVAAKDLTQDLVTHLVACGVDPDTFLDDVWAKYEFEEFDRTLDV